MSTRKHNKKSKTKKNKTMKFKKEACSPKKNGEALPFTCYTTDALIKLKKISSSICFFDICFKISLHLFV